MPRRATSDACAVWPAAVGRLSDATLRRNRPHARASASAGGSWTIGSLDAARGNLRAYPRAAGQGVVSVGDASIWIGVAILLAGVYLWLTANRLDRLHARVEGSRSALDAQLVRRSSVALELATSQLLDPATSLLLTEAAHAGSRGTRGRT